MTTMQCCGSSSWNPGCCSLRNHNAVTFDNVRKKYSVKEDIRVGYTLNEHMQQASTRDWIGIFPRGWTNLQQYLTFEYALVAPRTASSPNRTILFPRAFHREASPNIEYQFVYVSKEIQMLAMSLYFRFIREDEATRVLRIPFNGERTSTGENTNRIYVDPSPAFGCAPPRIVLSDQSLSSIRPSGIVSAANPRFNRSCGSCGKPRDISCGFAASRARVLATHNASLAERVLRLERELALTETVRCNLAGRLRSYESFVAEMLRSLAAKRAVKITDASGKEMVLQQVFNVEITGEQNVSKETFQQESDERTRENRENLSANDRVFVDEYLSTDKLPSTEDDRHDDERVQKQLPNDCVIDLDHHPTPLMASDIETQTQAGYLSRDKPLPLVQDPPPRNDAHEKTTIEAPCNSNEPGEQREKSVDDIAGQKIEIVDASAVEVRKEATPPFVEGGWTDGESVKADSEGKALKLKPSAIVIQGSNVKFAIIRY